MKHPREPFERLLDVFDNSFKGIAARRGLVFSQEPGHVSRSLRLPDDPLKRGVFLDLKEHWMQSDALNPIVVLRYGAWSRSRVLLRSFYDGKLSELTACIDSKLEQAVSEVLAISEEAVALSGKSLDDFAKGKMDL